jgi:hypothetical protein
MFQNQEGDIFQREGEQITENTELDALSNKNGLGKENPASSQEEQTKNEKDAKTSEGEQEEDDNNIPFHKHPRFKQVIEEKNRLKEELEEMKAHMEEKFNNLETKQSLNEIPSWFVEMFGDNEAAWKVWEKKEKADRENILKEAANLYEKQKAVTEEESQHWDQWVDDNVSSIPNIKNENDKNELLKIMLDYKPTDDEGNLDFQKGYNIWKMSKKQNEVTQNKKEIADVTNSESSAEKSNDKGYLTTNDIRGKAWYQI